MPTFLHPVVGRRLANSELASASPALESYSTFVRAISKSGGSEPPAVAA
jgi:hypothetical protein